MDRVRTKARSLPMFIGHFAVGMAGKRHAPDVSLALLLGAALLPDLLWPVFLALGFESVRVEPGHTAVSSLDLHDYPYSHSLLMTAVWALILAALSTRRHGVRSAAVIGALVLSHALLDVVAHSADVPLYPGSNTYWGLGLWNSLPATLIVEGIMFASALRLYACSTRPQNALGRFGLWVLSALLVALYLAAVFAPPRAAARDLLGGGAMLLALSVGAGWVDRNRTPRTDSALHQAPSTARQGDGPAQTLEQDRR